MPDIQMTTQPTMYGPARLLIAGSGHQIPLVVLHGYAASADQWRPLIARLGSNQRILAPDLLGFAGTPTPPPPYTVERWVEQVWMLLEAQGVARCVLVGHSLGGLVAVTAAARLAERCAGLVLINALGLPPPGYEHGMRGPLGLLLRVLRAPGIGEALFWALRGQRWLARPLALGAYHDPSRAPADAVDVWLDLIHRPGAHRAYLDVARRLEYLRAPAGPLDLPALIVWGVADHGLPPVLAEHYRKIVPRASVVLLPDTGHVPQVEAADEVAAAIQAFLGELAPAVHA